MCGVVESLRLALTYRISFPGADLLLFAFTDDSLLARWFYRMAAGSASPRRQAF